LYINLSEIWSDAGASLPFSLELLECPIESYDDTVAVESRVLVSGGVENAGSYVLLKADVYGTLMMTCGSCLESYAYPMQFEMEVRLSEQSDGTDYYVLENNRIDISSIVTEQIYLRLPIERKCSASCKGLCPVCGSNLNHLNCTCKMNKALEAGDSDNPFAALQNIFTDEEV